MRRRRVFWSAIAIDELRSSFANPGKCSRRAENHKDKYDSYHQHRIRTARDLLQLIAFDQDHMIAILASTDLQYRLMHHKRLMIRDKAVISLFAATGLTSHSFFRIRTSRMLRMFRAKVNCFA